MLAPPLGEAAGVICQLFIQFSFGEKLFSIS